MIPPCIIDDDYKAGHARCIAVEDAAAAPIATFKMQSKEHKNKDILTAFTQSNS